MNYEISNKDIQSCKVFGHVKVDVLVPEVKWTVDPLQIDMEGEGKGGERLKIGLKKKNHYYAILKKETGTIVNGDIESILYHERFQETNISNNISFTELHIVEKVT